MGESKRDKMEGSYNFLCGNSISTIGQKNLSYGILPQPSSEFLPTAEKVYLNIIEETTVIKNNRVETSLLWKFDEPHLTANRKISINSLESLKRKLQKTPDFAKHYHDQIQKYIALDHARHVNKEEAKSNNEIRKYIPTTKF